MEKENNPVLQDELLKIAHAYNLTVTELAAAVLHLFNSSATPPKSNTGVLLTDGYFTIPSLARRWGCSNSYVYKKIHSKELPATRIGKSWYIPEKSVLHFENPQGGRA